MKKITNHLPYLYLLASFGLFCWSVYLTFKPLPALTIEASELIEIPHESDQLLIIFQKEADMSTWQKQFQSLEEIAQTPRETYYLATTLPKSHLEQELQRLLNSTDIRFAEPNQLVNTAPLQIKFPLETTIPESLTLPTQINLGWVGAPANTDNFTVNDSIQIKLVQPESKSLPSSISSPLSNPLNSPPSNVSEIIQHLENIPQNKLNVIVNNWQITSRSPILNRYLRDLNQQGMLLVTQKDAYSSLLSPYTLALPDTNFSQNILDLSLLYKIYPDLTVHQIYNLFSLPSQDPNVFSLSKALEQDFDTQGPPFEVIGLPASTTNQTTLELTIAGDQVVAYKYKLDDGPWTSSPIPSDIPTNFQSLAAGVHQIKIIASDRYNQWTDQEQAFVYEWTIQNNKPEAIDTLQATVIDDNTIELQWILPSSIPPIASYDIRYSTTMINKENWNQSTIIDKQNHPDGTLATPSLRVNNLLDSQIYYFAIITKDDIENLSDISNIAKVMTPLSSETRILKTADDPQIYLTEKNTKHPVSSKSTLEYLGYSLEDVRTVSSEVLNELTTGQTIYHQVTLGELVTTYNDPVIYQIDENHHKKPINHIFKIIENGYNLEDIILIDPSSLEQYQ